MNWDGPKENRPIDHDNLRTEREERGGERYTSVEQIPKTRRRVFALALTPAVFMVMIVQAALDLADDPALAICCMSIGAVVGTVVLSGGLALTASVGALAGYLLLLLLVAGAATLFALKELWGIE